MKKSLLSTFLLLLVFPAFAQDKYFHELKGMEDSTGTTHLFYRLFEPEKTEECCQYWSNHITHFDTFTNSDSVIFESVKKPTFFFYDVGEKYVQDYLFLDNDILKPIWSSNRNGSWSNYYSYTYGYNDSFFYSGHHWSNKLGFGKNDTTSFIVKNYTDNASVVLLDNDSLPSIQYPYPILVKAIPEIPLCFENGNCFYGSSDSVRFLEYNYLDVNTFQNDHIYLTRNDSLFITKDLGDSISFLNSTFDWSTIGELKFSQEGSVVMAITENRFRINREKVNYSSNSLLRSSDNGETWYELKNDTSRIYISDSYPFNSLDFYMGVGTKLYFWNQLPSQFFKLAEFPSEITGIYLNSDSDSEILYILTEKELFKRENGIVISLKKLPISNEVPIEIPSSVTLHQNYPNPFNPSTIISFELDRSAQVTLTVFDALGRTISTLVNERKVSGSHHVTFNASSLSSGIYFYRLEAGDFMQTKQLTLIK